jgi:hypothetical protein
MVCKPSTKGVSGTIDHAPPVPTKPVPITVLVLSLRVISAPGSPVPIILAKPVARTDHDVGRVMYAGSVVLIHSLF